jgi:hypothetical protein
MSEAPSLLVAKECSEESSSIDLDYIAFENPPAANSSYTYLVARM